MTSRLEKELADGAELKGMFEEYYSQFSVSEYSSRKTCIVIIILDVVTTVVVRHA